MSTKDEILANFQACSGIEDYGEAFVYLEDCNWDLVEALNKAIPDQEPPPSSFDQFAQRNLSNLSRSFHNSRKSPQEAEVIEIDDSPSPVPLTTPQSLTSSATSLVAAMASSSTPSAVINLHIKVTYGGATEGSSFPLEIPGSTTVGELQTMLYQLVGIPPCNQILEGFETPVQPDNVITPSILPKNLTLTLNASNVSTFNNSFDRLNGSSSDEYNLKIRDEKNGKEYILKYSGTKSIKDLKTDVFHLTNIAARYQLWTGWPPSVTDDSTLASSGISREHHLSVSQNKEKTPRLHRRNIQNNMANGSEENSSADEFEDASSEIIPEEDFLIMCDAPPTPRPKSLIPPNVTSEEEGTQKFTEEFSNRYGPYIPLFFNGTLNDALKNSVMLPAKQRKLLAVYLHHDSSVLSNVFCSQTLCQQSLVDYLTANFVVWGWDITHDSNKNKLLDLVSSNFGIMAVATVKSFNVERLPALMIINRSRGSIEVLSVVHGNSVLDEVMMSLLHSHELFDEQRRTEVWEEEAREVRENVKAEQDAAYQSSLEADRAKAEVKRIAELEERVERERQQSIREQENAMKEAVKASLINEIPDEPSPNSTEAITKFRFRVPDSDPFERAFTRKTSLQMIVNFLYVRGYPADEFKYLQSWPRRCITQLDLAKTLDQLNFPNQETITVEERLAEDD